MKRIMISAAVIAGMFAGTPLTAQSQYGDGYRNTEWNSQQFWQGASSNTWERIRFVQQRIDRGVRDGSLSRREARRAEWQLRQIRQDATQMRRAHGGSIGRRDSAVLQARLDELTRNIRWARHNGQVAGGYGDRDGYSGGYQGGYDESRFRTDYDAAHYYRDGSGYQERRLSSDDEVYRGSDGRYYCKRSDGTTGLIVGAAAGGLLGNAVDGGHNRLAGTLIGGALGALAGKAIEQNADVRCR